jgi:hypothetical protein
MQLQKHGELNIKTLAAVTHTFYYAKYLMKTKINAKLLKMKSEESLIMLPLVFILREKNLTVKEHLPNQFQCPYFHQNRSPPQCPSPSAQLSP